MGTLTNSTETVLIFMFRDNFYVFNALFNSFEEKLYWSYDGCKLSRRLMFICYNEGIISQRDSLRDHLMI